MVSLLPLLARNQRYRDDITSSIMHVHVVAMRLPSAATGAAIARSGAARVMMAGLLVQLGGTLRCEVYTSWSLC